MRYCFHDEATLEHLCTSNGECDVGAEQVGERDKTGADRWRQHFVDRDDERTGDIAIVASDADNEHSKRPIAHGWRQNGLQCSVTLWSIVAFSRAVTVHLACVAIDGFSFFWSAISYPCSYTQPHASHHRGRANVGSSLGQTGWRAMCWDDLGVIQCSVSPPIILDTNRHVTHQDPFKSKSRNTKTCFCGGARRRAWSRSKRNSSLAFRSSPSSIGGRCFVEPRGVPAQTCSAVSKSLEVLSDEGGARDDIVVDTRVTIFQVFKLFPLEQGRRVTEPHVHATPFGFLTQHGHV